MTQKIKLPILLIMLGASVAILTTAFTKISTKSSVKAGADYAYFQYTASAYTEAAFENTVNWSYIGSSNPVTNPCTPGSSHTCTIKVLSSNLNAYTGSMSDKFAQYLADSPSATNFVNSSSNYTYQKQ